MAKSNINSNDISFLNSIRYLVNVSSNNTSNADKTEDQTSSNDLIDSVEDGSISIDLSVISTENGIKLDLVEANFLELLD